MSNVTYIYADYDDRADLVEPTKLREYLIRIGDATIHLRPRRAEQLHADGDA